MNKWPCTCDLPNQRRLKVWLQSIIHIKMSQDNTDWWSYLMDTHTQHREALSKLYLWRPTDVIKWIPIKVQFAQVCQCIQCIAGLVFIPSSDAGLYSSGLDGGLRLPNSNISTISKRLYCISWNKENIYRNTIIHIYTELFIFVLNQLFSNTWYHLTTETQLEEEKVLYDECVNWRRHRLLVKSSANLWHSGLLFPLLLQSHHGDRLIPSDLT